MESLSKFHMPPFVVFSCVIFLLAGCASSRSTEKKSGNDGTSADSEQIDTGYTRDQARDAAGGTGQVSDADFKNRGTSRSVEELLQGRISGVYVTQTNDGGIAVRIRGTTSPVGSNQPLFVVDGVQLTPGPGGSLTGISPEDIDSITVLKGADAALYGMRGAYGVIVITTKRGK